MDRLARQLRRLSEFDKSAVMEALAQALRESTVERFRTQTGPDGRRWPDSRRVREIGGSTLTDTANLRNSIRSMAGSSSFAIGTNVKYARTHQFGDQGRVIRPKKRKCLRFRIGNQWITAKKVTVDIPARPFLGVSNEDMEEIRGTLEDTLMER